MSYAVSGKSIFAFSKNNVCAVTVPSGATIEMETQDCFANQIQNEDDSLDALDWDCINPAAGPVYVEGAEKGDVLKVTIEEISISNQGVMSTGKESGVLGGLFDSLHFRLMQIKDGAVHFNPEISLPVNPMIGVIGVAPEGEAIGCGTPGSHGGNMDNQMVTAGAILYLPVFVKGALFALGDLHAAMGDGEIGVTGVEIPGRVKVRLEVKKGISIKNPVLENEKYFSTIASAISLDEAVKQATEDMAGFLMNGSSLLPADAVMLMSAAGNAQICQVVDPLMTARFVMPKWILKRLDYRFLGDALI